MFGLDNIASSYITSPVLLMSKLIIIPKVFTEYQNVMLETVDETIDSHIITHITKTIWVYGQIFTLLFETWK